MGVVMYRPFQNGDFDELSRIVGGVWHDGAAAESVLTMGKIDLATYMRRATWSCVAEVGGAPVGLVLARAGDAPASHDAHWARIAEWELNALEAMDPERAAEFKAYRVVEAQIDHRLLEESGADERYEVVLFAMGEASRGLGIGRELFNRVEAYLAEAGAPEAFLYTDSSCTYQFYDHRGLRCAAEYYPEDPQAEGLLEEYFVYVTDLGRAGKPRRSEL